MAHAYCSSLFHCVFSTKDRRAIISSEMQPRLWAYLGGVAREHGMVALAVGGMPDHVHLLLSIPASVPISRAMQEIKAGSSRWMHIVTGKDDFAWQNGYGAFSIGSSQAESAVAYIASQREHHQRRDFQAEFIAILKRNRIEYDPRFVWG